MKKPIKILGILFSIVTVVIAISFFVDDEGYKDQSRFSWMMVTMCGSLIFNGGTSYLTKKDKKGLLPVGVGIIILIFVIIKFPF